MRRRREIGKNADGEPIWAPAPVVPPLIDLTKICRDAAKLSTTILIYTDYERSEWLRLGQCRLRARESNQKGIWELAAYLENATDFEHDSAFALKMELVGVMFEGIEYGQTSFQAWIKSDDPEDFRVPNAGYDPRKHKDTARCKEKQCEDKGHYIVPEGFYVPPPNIELYEAVKGRRIEVQTGLRRKDG